MSYYKVLRVFKNCFDVDEFINTVTEGDIDELDLANKNIFGLAHIVIDGGTESRNITTFNVQLQVVDIVTQTGLVSTDKFIGDNNEQDAYNTTHNVLRRAFLKFVRDTENEGVIVDDNASFQKIQDYENRIVGWELSLVVQVPDLDMSVC